MKELRNECKWSEISYHITTYPLIFKSKLIESIYKAYSEVLIEDATLG